MPPKKGPDIAMAAIAAGATSRENTPLVDLPYQYLVEKSQWTDFKRALNVCGLTWNLGDWMSTILHKGKDYNLLEDKGENLDEIFKLPVVSFGENKHAEVGGDKSRKLMKLLGFPKNMGEYITPSIRFCNLNKLEFEPESKLPARQKMWSWMLKCLHGQKSMPGPYYYITQQCTPYDISFLFKRLLDVLETVTICSLDDEVYNVTHLDFDPTKQDLFSYLEDLRRAVRRLGDLNERLPDEGRVILSETYIRSRLVRAARQIPVYKSVIDNLISQPVEIWSKLTVEEL